MHMSKFRSVIFAALSCTAMSFPAIAQTADDRAACQPDAVKFCPTFAGKPDDMKKCLLTNKDKLAPACKKVVEAARS
jgi:hypothetical protein